MRLTAMTDYSLRLLIYVAQSSDERLCTIAEIAGVYGLSEAHLMKITNHLSREGWIETIRGKGGGIRLAKAAEKIKIGDVVRSVESDFALVECFSTGNDCILNSHCKLASVLSQALGQFMNYLDQYTLADIAPAEKVLLQI